MKGFMTSGLHSNANQLEEASTILYIFIYKDIKKVI